MDNLFLTTFKHVRDNNPQQTTLSWSELSQVLTEHERRREKDGPLWSPTLYQDGATRGKENVVLISCLVLDFDDGISPEKLQPAWERWEYVIHSTFSHSPERPKFRAVFPLSSPVPGEEWPNIYRRLAAALGGGHADLVCKDCSRIYYLPAAPQGAPVFAHHHSGEWLNPEDFPEDSPEEGEELRPGGEDWREAWRKSASSDWEVSSVRLESYVHAALEDELAQIAVTPTGDRNNQLNRSAFAIGQLLSWGILKREEVEDALLAAALNVGLEEQEARSTIRSGLDAGEKEPRKLPEDAERPSGKNQKNSPAKVEAPPQAERLADFADWVNWQLNKRSGRVTKQHVAEHLKDWLLEHDRLFFDRQSRQGYLLTDDSEAVSLSSPSNDLEDALAETGMNPTELAFKWLYHAVAKAARKGGKRVYLSHGATITEDGAICVSCGLRHYVEARPGEPFVLRRNGENGVLFASESAFPEWNYEAEIVSPLTIAAFNPPLTAPLEVPQYAEEVQKKLLFSWMAGVLSGLRPVPLLAVIGGRGSGKTTLCRAIMQTFFGPGEHLTTLSSDERDFWAAVVRDPVFALDNADSSAPPWLGDVLAAAVTRICRKRRKLYTDVDLSKQASLAALLVNSRTASFCRTDVAERVIPIFVGSITKDMLIPENDLDSQVLEYRSGILVYLLTKAAETLRKQKDAPRGLPLRFAGYARWFWGWYAALGYYWEAPPALGALKKVQMLSIGDADPLLAAILEYGERIPPERMFRRTPAELIRELEDVGANLPYLGGGKAIAGRLRELRAPLDMAGWRLEWEQYHHWTVFTLTKAVP